MEVINGRAQTCFRNMTHYGEHFALFCNIIVILVSKEAPAFKYSIREVIINPPNLNNSYNFPFLCGVI
jgi:hypothetical protein